MNPPASLAVLVLGASSACATYTPKPLPGDSLATSLRVPGKQALQIKLSELPDPVSTSVELNLDDGLGPDEAAVLAVLLNPSVQALRVRRGVRSAELLLAGLLPEPSLGLSTDVPTGGAMVAAVTGYGVGLGLSDWFGRSARAGAARARVGALDLDILWQESLLAGRVRGSVYVIAAARAALSLLDDQVALIEQDVERVRAAVEAGQATALELAALEADLGAARAARVQLEAAVAAAAIELTAMIGLPPDANTEVAVLARDPAREVTRCLPEILSRMEFRRMDLMALRRGYQSQEESVRAAILGQFPRLSFGPVFSQDTGNLRTLGMGLAIDLPIFGRSSGEIGLQRATREALFAEYTARVHAARTSIALELNRCTSLALEIDVLRGRVQLQESLVKTLRVGLSEGYADVISYDRARRDLLELRITRVLAAGELRAARVLVEVLSGQTWPGASKAEQAPSGGAVS